MILARLLGFGFAAWLAIFATGAHADVLEVGEGGARWVSGPLAQVPGLDEQGLAPGFAATEPLVSGQVVPQVYAAKVAELAVRYDLSPALIEALVWQESRWHHGAVSPKGAQGLAQLMPGTARYLGVDPRDPFANLEGGARYLREQLDRFDGDLEKALAAYNAGPGRVERAGGIPRIRETQAYVAAIMGRLAQYSGPQQYQQAQEDNR
ncbi:MAG: lytic transglycosylase domain-containing protein [Alphaproteobacteria bacterium]|nr:MAG: lytic transglycosylase domain-containing protein [Alphaproteobacteria bacterium]